MDFSFSYILTVFHPGAGSRKRMERSLRRGPMFT